MAPKIFFIISSIVVALLLVEAVICQEIIRPQPDVLFIQNPDTEPIILSPKEALMGPQRNNLVCTAVMCRNVCNALGFIFGRCNINNVCVCSNF